MTHNKLKPTKINSLSDFTTPTQRRSISIHLFLINIAAKCTEHTTNDIYRKLLFSETEAL